MLRCLLHVNTTRLAYIWYIALLGNAFWVDLLQCGLFNTEEGLAEIANLFVENPLFALFAAFLMVMCGVASSLMPVELSIQISVFATYSVIGFLSCAVRTWRSGNAVHVLHFCCFHAAAWTGFGCGSTIGQLWTRNAHLRRKLLVMATQQEPLEERVAELEQLTAELEDERRNALIEQQRERLSEKCV